MDVLRTNKTLAVTLAVILGTMALWLQPDEVRGAAVTYVGDAQNVVDNGADVTVDLSTITGLAEDDLVILVGGIPDDDRVDFTMALVSASGWTKEADLFADDTDGASLGVWYKFMGATPDTSVTVDGLGGVDTDTVAVAMAFRNVDTAGPFDVSSVISEEINTSLPDPRSIDHSGDAGVVVVVAATNAHTSAVDTCTPSASYQTNFAQQAASDSTDGGVYIGYNTSPSDPEDPAQWTCTNSDTTNNSNAVVTMALKPTAAVEEEVQRQDIIWFQ